MDLFTYIQKELEMIMGADKLQSESVINEDWKKRNYYISFNT